MDATQGIASRTALWTVLALVAFAANSVLCRQALAGHHIDALSFAVVRIASGALALVLLARAGSGGGIRGAGDWTSTGALLLYVIPFSLAYLRVDAGTGALLLFGAVQVTMVLAGLAGGERPRPLEWLGLALAIAGLVYLVSPGLSAPPLGAAALMLASGVGWGWYSLRGRGVRQPLRVTAGNFVRCTPLVCAAWAAGLLYARPYASGRGLVLAVLSGAAASGVGYALWYAALPRLGAVRAATLQLSVPVLAAGGGVLFLGEAVSSRLALAASAILGGVGLALVAKRG